MLVHPDADHAAHLAMRAGDRHPRARGQHHAEGGPQLDGKPRRKVYCGEILSNCFDHVVPREREAQNDPPSAKDKDPDGGLDGDLVWCLDKI